MKKIKLNKIKLGLSILGIVGATALVAPILVSCSNSNKPTTPEPPVDPEKPPVEPELPDSGKPIEGVTAKATNDLTIWEMNAIAAGNRDIKLLSRAFDGLTPENILTIQSVTVNKGIIKLIQKETLNSVNSIASTNTTTILIGEGFSFKYLEVGGIWFGKTEISEADLKGTTEIGEQAFSNSNLTKVTLPNSLTIIGIQAFFGNKLTTVSIPNSVTSIEENAFTQNGMTSVTIPEGVISIGNYAFYKNFLTTVKIPESVKSIGKGAFLKNGFTSSKDIEITVELLDSVCNWKDNNGASIPGDGKTVKVNFNRHIFGVSYTS